MEKFMPLILDVLVIFLLCYCTYRGYRSGFLKTVVNFLGYIISLAVAFAGSRILSEWITAGSRGYFLNFVTERMDFSAGADSIAEQWNQAMPASLIKAAEFLGIHVDKINPDAAVSEIAGNVTDHVVMPIVGWLVQGILFLLLFGICCFLVRKLASALGVVRRVPLIGSVNALLGGIIGCLQCFVFLMIITSAISLIFGLTGGFEPYLTPNTVAESRLLHLIYTLNPFVLS